jgi:hypothetical protein
MWLDAEDTASVTLNGSTVSQWSDKSGNNNHAVQATAANQPTYLNSGLNSKPTVSLDGTTDFMTANISGFKSFSALSYFSVLQTPLAAAPDTNSANFFAFGNIGAGSGPYPANRGIVLASTAAALSGEYLTIAGEINHAGRIGSTTYRRNANTPQILHFQTSSAGSAVWANASGVSLDLAATITTSTNLAPSAIGYTVDDSFHIGILRSGGTLPAQPAIRFSEIIVLSAIASTADRQKIEGYLAWKWGTEADLPSTHPYRYAPPVVEEPAWDADALDYIGRVQSADAQKMELPVRVAIDRFVQGCKADGIWSAIKASCILAGARTLSGALVPLVGTAPTNFNFVAGDYNRKTGLLGDGSTKYLSSNRNNNADPQNSNHNAAWVSTAHSLPVNGQYLGTGIGNPGTNNLAHSISPVTSFTRNRSAASFDSFKIALGLFGHSRNSASAYTARVNGVTTTLNVVSATPENAIVDVFRRGTGNYANARLAFYSIGESLDLARLDARVAQLIAELGAAIP